MDNMREIVPGLEIYIHEDAVSDGSVVLQNEQGIPLDIELIDKVDGTYHLSAYNVNKILGYREKVEYHKQFGGGWYQVEGEKFPFTAHTQGQAYKKALEYAVILHGRKHGLHPEPQGNTVEDNEGANKGKGE